MFHRARKSPALTNLSRIDFLAMLYDFNWLPDRFANFKDNFYLPLSIINYQLSTINQTIN